MKAVKTPDKIKIIKEQLRAQTRELNKQESGEGDTDAKIKYLLAASRKIIFALETEKREKEKTGANIILPIQGIPDEPWEFTPRQESIENSRQTAPTRVAPGTIFPAPISIKPVYLQDPELVQELHKLREKNQTLQVHIHSEQEERGKLKKDRHLLIKEVKRLRKNPGSTKTVKDEVKEIENQLQVTQQSYQQLLKEKHGLIGSYERLLAEQSGIRGKKKQHQDVIDDLRKELESLRVERDSLERDLREEKEMFEQNLSQAHQRLNERGLALQKRVNSERGEREKLKKTRNIVIEEVKGLWKNPDKIKEVKEIAEEIEIQSQETQQRYHQLLQENHDLILSYERSLSEQSSIIDKKQRHLAGIRELNQKLGNLRKERDRLQRDLSEEKEMFNQNLIQEIEKVENELRDKIDILRLKKSSLGKFAEEVSDRAEAPVWMITYADMATILLTFFVLYFSIAAVNVAKFKSAILGDEHASIGLLELLDSVEIKQNIQKMSGSKSENILSDIRDVAEGQTSLNVSVRESKVVVRVPGGTLFPAGSADLQKEGLPALNEVIRILRKYPNYQINIRGHTDDTPISTERYPTNWELSSARATAVLRHFIDRGIDSERITATGFADTYPLALNTTEAGRAKNRRVEIVLEKM